MIASRATLGNQTLTPSPKRSVPGPVSSRLVSAALANQYRVAEAQTEVPAKSTFELARSGPIHGGGELAGGCAAKDIGLLAKHWETWPDSTTKDIMSRENSDTGGEVDLCVGVYTVEKLKKRSASLGLGHDPAQLL